MLGNLLTFANQLYSFRQSKNSECDTFANLNSKCFTICCFIKVMFTSVTHWPKQRSEGVLKNFFFLNLLVILRNPTHYFKRQQFTSYFSVERIFKFTRQLFSAISLWLTDHCVKCLLKVNSEIQWFSKFVKVTQPAFTWRRSGTFYLTLSEFYTFSLWTTEGL